MTKSKLHICIVTRDYPSEARSVFTFVEQLVTEFAELGTKCSVIAPFSVTKSLFRRISMDSKFTVSKTKGGNHIEIYRPRFYSFSNFRPLIRLSVYFEKCVINRVLKNLPKPPDVLYSHFWISGVKCYDYALKNKIPLFVASGESTIPSLNFEKNFHLAEFRNYVSGVICVSEKNKSESIEKGLTCTDKCIVLPNGVDLSKFYIKDKKESRDSMGYSDSDFIIAFVGHFNERKGSLRVASAINTLNDKSIKSIFIGSGPLAPDCNGILFSGSLKHDNIVDYLNCADAFVLPTLHEGCSNAIIEAMACGLPIISSDLPFNFDLLNDENSIRVDPNNIGAIARAIKELKDNPVKRDRLSAGALKTAEALSISKRAERIIDFINSAHRIGSLS